jgi:S1-C subfamily serine protease
VGGDSSNDLAVLKIDVPAEKLHPVELSTSADLKVGQLAIAIGNPLGLEQSMSAGIVSALGRQIERSAMEQSLYDVIQTDAAINPGNSGGPLLDSQGKVIGVNSAIANLTGGSIGIGFAVPVDTVKKIVPVLIAKGRYPHPWLGITGYALTSGFAELLNLSVSKGVLVMDLDSGGPAERAGVRGPSRQVVIRNMRIPVGGDIIIAVDGNPVENMDQLLRYLDTQKQIGEAVTLSVVRDGANLDVRVRLEELPGG